MLLSSSPLFLLMGVAATGIVLWDGDGCMRAHGTRHHARMGQTHDTRPVESTYPCICMDPWIPSILPWIATQEGYIHRPFPSAQPSPSSWAHGTDQNRKQSRMMITSYRYHANTEYIPVYVPVLIILQYPWIPVLHDNRRRMTKQTLSIIIACY